MKYLMIIKHAESYRSQSIPQGLLDAMGEFVAAPKLDVDAPLSVELRPGEVW